MFTKEEVQRLLDIANYGSHKGQPAPARKILENILAFYPEHSGALLGLAHNHITVGDYGKAKEILQNIIGKNSTDMEAKALLGLCFILADKKEEAKPLLEEVKNSEAASRTLAKDLLNNL